MKKHGQNFAKYALVVGMHLGWWQLVNPGGWVSDGEIVPSVARGTALFASCMLVRVGGRAGLACLSIFL